MAFWAILPSAGFVPSALLAKKPTGAAVAKASLALARCPRESITELIGSAPTPPLPRSAHSHRLFSRFPPASRRHTG